MCSDASAIHAPLVDNRSKPLTPGAALDEALAEKDRENEALRRRMDEIEHENARLRRELGW